MDIAAIIVMLFLMAYLNMLKENKIMKVIFCIVTFYIGLMIMIEGITWGSTQLIIAASTNSIIAFTVMALGSLVTGYAIAIEEPEENK